METILQLTFCSYALPCVAPAARLRIGAVMPSCFIFKLINFNQMEYLLISSIIQSIILFYLLHKVHKLERPVKHIEPERLKKLEHFYKQICKTPEMTEWSELTNNDKMKLFNSSEYLSYNFDIAKADVKKAFQRTFLFRKIQRVVEWLSRLLA